MPEASDLTIVVTRPRIQADNLCQRLEQDGYRVIRFPVIDIQPPSDPERLHKQLAKLEHYQLAIFVSANAVSWAQAQMKSIWPEALPIAAIGQATAKALSQHGLKADLVAPEPYNSEALLSLPELNNLKDKRVLIIRGEGGREHLAQTLRERGAEVEYAECYRRTIPMSDIQGLRHAWDSQQVLLFVITSNEGLQNLYDMIGQTYQQNLLSSPMVVVSDRTASKAIEMGFIQQPLVADSASDEAILTVINIWSARETQS